MQRLRLFFALVILALALPFWRFCDLLVILAPYDQIVKLTLILWFTLFIAVPLRLTLRTINILILLGMIGLFGGIAWWTSPLSSSATTDAKLGHCGYLSYTGMIYPLKNFLTDAQLDDLEARNQMCWVKKLIQQIQADSDFVINSEIVHQILIMPERKYRATLPLIAYYLVKLNLTNKTSYPENTLNSIKFWTTQYTEEISARSYPI
jgi:hypothetical protein